MGFYGGLMGFNGILFYGILWDLMGFTLWLLNIAMENGP